MRSFIIIAIYISAALLAAACSPESASLVSQQTLPDVLVDRRTPVDPEQQVFDWVQEDGGQSQLDFNPQLDILFVIDNSESMKATQENLFKNMDQFTRGITKNKMIDYHIGAISVWDSSDKYVNAGQKYGIGELRYIKDGRGQNYNRRYVVKTDSRDILASTLKIGAVPLKDGGPEWEEMLSPLAAALEKTGRGAVNEDFFRPEAQLVVIFVTDADDGTKTITPEQIVQKLVDFKGGRREKVSVYGALVRAKDSDSTKDWSMRVHPTYHPECFEKKGKQQVKIESCGPFGPERLEQVIALANQDEGTPAQVMSKFIIGINSKTFGTELGSVGDSITIKTLKKEIFLSQRPRVDANGKPMIKVNYGQQVIEQKAQGGWLYNPRNNSVVLSGDINYQYVEGARFTVTLSPLTY